ncbi:MAG TPA: hypothetical protein VML55_14825, partial [Planctomycetaceae bacterium]|nr:hypothetical protein [Planctomycetaceae bacterium]
MPSVRSTALVAVALAGMAVLAGCQDHESIQQYTVVKPEVLNASGRVSTPSAGTAPQAEERYPARTLGAIVPQSDQTWYFKLMGPDEAVEKQDGALRKFLATVSFAGGRPTWTLPEGWVERGSPSGGVRFATIEVPADEQPLELTVIPLPAQGDADESLLANVNRWRDQLALPPIDGDALRQQVETVPLAEGTASFVNIAGQASKTDSMTGAPLAAGGARDAGGFTHP